MPCLFLESKEVELEVVSLVGNGYLGFGGFMFVFL